MAARTVSGIGSALIGVAIAGILIAWSPAASTQETRGRAPAPAFEAVNIGGLSHESVQSIVQDQDGFLWFGTWDGLDRWDGLDVVSYTHDPDDPDSVSNSGVAALLNSTDGYLWVATLNGLDRLDPHSGLFEHFDLPLDAGRPQGNTYRWALFEATDGSIWAGSSDGLFVLRPGHDQFASVKLLENAQPVDASGVIRISEDSQGALWMLKSGGWPLSEATLCRVRNPGSEPDRLEVSTLALDSPRSVSFLLDRQDRFWAGTTSARSLEQGEGLRLEPADGSELLPTSAHLQDRAGRVWIGTFQGLYVSEPGMAGALPVALGNRSGFLDSYVLSIFEDRAGAIWVSTIAGIFRHDPAVKAFGSLAENRDFPNLGLTSNRVASMVRDPNDNLWVGTWGSGVDRVNMETGEVTHFPVSAGEPGGLPPADMHLLHMDEEGRIRVVAGRHVCLFQDAGSAFECVAPEDANNTDTFWNLAASPRGTLFLASNNLGLVEFDPDHMSFTRRLEGNASSRSIQAMAMAGDSLWFADIHANLVRYKPVDGTLETFPPLLSDHGRTHSIRGINDIHVDGNGSLWIGTSEGLLHLDPPTATSRLYTRSDGLPGSHVYAVLEDQDGILWGSTNRGLIRIDQASDGSVTIRDFSRADGVNGMEFNRRARHRDSNGLLYFGGKEGITWFDPDEIRDNDYRPPIALSQVQISGDDGTVRSVPAGGMAFQMGPDDHSISFQFAALSFTHPERNRFRYRLENLDENWVEAGTRRFATYTSLPAGEYALYVQGSNNDGIWSDVSQVANIHVLPPFWATWWFRGLVLAGFVALLTLVYRWRVARLIEMERLRTRIAGDLHDDLSSDLSGIALTMDLLENSERFTGDDRQKIIQVRKTAINMIDGIRDLVWYLDSGHDTLESLWLRMRQFAETLLVGREVEMNISAPERTVLIDMGLRKQIYLMFKEILHNIVKHSDATRVVVDLNLTGARLDLCVQDDGLGISAANDSDGFGLGSLQRRCQQVDGDLKIESAENRGTTVRLSVDVERFPNRMAV